MEQKTIDRCVNELKHIGFRELIKREDFKKVGVHIKQPGVFRKDYRVFQYQDSKIQSLIVFDQNRHDWDVTMYKRNYRSEPMLSMLIAREEGPDFKTLIRDFKKTAGKKKLNKG